MSEPNEIQKLLKSVRGPLRTLIVVTMLLALAVLLCVVAVFGDLVEYHAGEALLRGAARSAGWPCWPFSSAGWPAAGREDAM